MRRKHRYIAFAATAAIAAFAASAQTRSESDDLRSGMEALRKGQEAIQKELREMRSLLMQLQKLAARPTPEVPPDTVLDLVGRPTRGAVGARLAVIEFLDYQ